MRIAIVDDESAWRQQTEEMVRRNITQFTKEETEMITFDCGEHFLEAAEYFDIVFMDIEMEGKDGFETIELYQEKFPESLSIILTTHTELGRKGYRVAAFRYIDKLELAEELNEALESAVKVLGRNVKISIAVKTLGEIKLPVKDILYFETELRKVKIHTKQDVYICRENMGELEEKLKERGFYRVHRCYLVNMQWAGEFNKKEICMKNGNKVLLSGRKYQDFKKEYMKWKFGNGNR